MQLYVGYEGVKSHIFSKFSLNEWYALPYVWVMGWFLETGEIIREGIEVEHRCEQVSFIVVVPILSSQYHKVAFGLCIAQHTVPGYSSSLKWEVISLSGRYWIAEGMGKGLLWRIFLLFDPHRVCGEWCISYRTPSNHVFVPQLT